MADNKRWFKVWNSILTDPSFLDLSLEQIGRWTLLGVMTAVHGDNGKLTVTKNSLGIMLRCNSEELKSCLLELPNISINDNDSFTVIIKNWIKYQKDSGVYLRLKRYRKNKMITAIDNVISPVISESKEKEENKEEERKKVIQRKKEEETKEEKENILSSFDTFWQIYPRKIGKGAARKKWDTLKKIGNLAPLETILQAINQQKQSEQWTKDSGEFIPYPTTWLNQERWSDEIKGLITKESFFANCPKCGKETTKDDLRKFDSCPGCFKPPSPEKIKELLSGIK